MFQPTIQTPQKTNMNIFKISKHVLLMHNASNAPQFYSVDEENAQRLALLIMHTTATPKFTLEFEPMFKRIDVVCII